jgi:phosphoribosylaminoimidazole-succinocarboxamide synthase
MIARGYLLGSFWNAYDQGVRQIGGVTLREGMNEFDAFPEVLITPTTKAEEGHDEPITVEDIISQGLASKDDYLRMASMSKSLFDFGTLKAMQRGLLLADTKYEFGMLPSGRIILIDEVHTPDSSRYFKLSEYKDYWSNRTGNRPEQLSKEFIREWLKQNGFSGKPGETAPDLPDEVVMEISNKYTRLFEIMTGLKLMPIEFEDVDERLDYMRQSIETSLTGLLAA